MTKRELSEDAQQFLDELNANMEAFAQAQSAQTEAEHQSGTKRLPPAMKAQIANRLDEMMAELVQAHHVRINPTAMNGVISFLLQEIPHRMGWYVEDFFQQVSPEELETMDTPVFNEEQARQLIARIANIATSILFLSVAEFTEMPEQDDMPADAQDDSSDDDQSDDDRDDHSDDYPASA